MNEKANHPKNGEPSNVQDCHMVDNILNNASLSIQITPKANPLDKVKEPTPCKRSRKREER